MESISKNSGKNQVMTASSLEMRGVGLEPFDQGVELLQELLSNSVQQQRQLRGVGWLL